MRLKFICIEIAVKLVKKGSQLLSKVELRPNETCKTSVLGIAAKFRMHFIGSSVKTKCLSDILVHESFLENFMKA